MPQFMWEGVFSILNVLVPGVVLALFALYYQHSRERKIKIEGKLAIERINAYERLLFYLYKGQDTHKATLQEEKDAETIFWYFDVKTFHCEYSDIFRTMESFDSFYEGLVAMAKENKAYLDSASVRKLDRSIGLYTHLKLYTDAFCDTEHAEVFKLGKDVAKMHIDWMYKLVGMLMFSECTRAYAIFEQEVTRQMNRFSLTYRDNRIAEMARDVRDKLVYAIERRSYKGGLLGKICEMAFYKMLSRQDRNFINTAFSVVDIMRYVHFSHRFTPHEFFDTHKVPAEELQLYNEVFLAQLHRG